MVSLIPDSTLKRLRGSFGGELDALSPGEVQALATADLEGVVSNVRLQDHLTDHPVDITHMLQGLCERGFLVSDNRRRWTTYRLARPSRADLALPEEALLQDSAEAASGGDSSHLPGDSSHLEVDSSHLPGDSSHLKADTMPAQGDRQGDEAAEELLRRLAEPVVGKGKVSNETMRATIEKLCKGRYLSAEQIGRLLERRPEGIRARFLAPMVHEGTLTPRYPESPNRPDQAYTLARRP